LFKGQKGEYCSDSTKLAELNEQKNKPMYSFFVTDDSNGYRLQPAKEE
jgi:hypothetical protein